VLCPLIRSAYITTVRRNADLAVAARMPGGLFHTAATHESTKSAAACLGRLSSKQVRENSKQVRQTILKSRLRDQLSRYHRSSSVRVSMSSTVQASPRNPLTSAHPVMPGFKPRRCAKFDNAARPVCAIVSGRGSFDAFEWPGVEFIAENGGGAGLVAEGESGAAE
jgi:hypothetical protein